MVLYLMVLQRTSDDPTQYETIKSGEYYSIEMDIDSGDAVLYNVDLYSGELPPGMDYVYSEAHNPTVYGTPTTAGTYHLEFLITLSDGVSIYATGDTSTTAQMSELAERNIHYAFFVCDGRFNMDINEAIACANLVKAQHSIPYHMAPGSLFDQKRAELFDVPGRLIIPAGEEIVLE